MQELKQDRYLEEGIKEEAMAECCSVACFLWLDQGPPAQEQSTEGWVLPHQQLMNRIPYIFGTEQFDGGIFSVNVSSSKMSLDYAKLKKKKKKAKEYFR